MSRVIDVAMDALETPFAHQGRDLVNGLDCAGLFFYVCQRLGVEHEPIVAYPDHPFGGQMEKELRKQPGLVEISPRDAEPGDILVMRITKAPQHIAFYAGEDRGHPYVIHASSLHGKVCLHRMDDLWKHRVKLAFRIKTT